MRREMRVCVCACGNCCSLRMAENFSSRPEVDRSGRKVSAILKKAPVCPKHLAPSPTGRPAGRQAGHPADQPTADRPVGRPTDRPASWGGRPASRPAGQFASRRMQIVCVYTDSLQRCSEVQPWVVLISPWRPPKVSCTSPGSEMHDTLQWIPLPSMSCSVTSTAVPGVRILTSQKKRAGVPPNQPAKRTTPSADIFDGTQVRQQKRKHAAPNLFPEKPQTCFPRPPN